MRGVFPSGRQTLRIIWLTVSVIFWITFGAGMIYGVVTSFYTGPDASASERANKIIEDMNRMRATLRAFMAWYTDGFEDIHLGIKLFNVKTEEVIGEFTTFPDGPIEAHSYTINSKHDDRVTKTIKIARDNKYNFRGNYILTVMDNGKAFYVGYRLGDNASSKLIRKSLTAKARANGLLGKDGKTCYNRDDEVYMLVENLSGQGGKH